MAFHQLSVRNFRVAGDERKTLDIDVGGKILLFVKTQGCEGCMAFFPVFQELARTDRRVGYAILDISSPSEKAIVRMSRDTSTPIGAVPYIVMYNNGSPVAKYNGKKNFQAVQSFITSIIHIIETQRQQSRPFVHETPKQTFHPPSQAYNPYQPASSSSGSSYQDSKVYMPETGSKPAMRGAQNSLINDIEDEDEDVLLIPDEITPYNTPWKSDYKKMTID